MATAVRADDQHPGWPFTEAEWDAVKEPALAAVNASIAGDAVLREAAGVELMAVLDALRAVHGDHPVLTETAADFADDPAERRGLYEKAVREAVAGGWPTYTIRLSLARLLLDEFERAEDAMRELRASEAEVDELGDEWERRDWSELVGRCGPQPQ